MPSVICHPSAAAHSSASAVDNADKVARLDLHVMMDPAHTITNPFWDFVSAPANPASLYTMRLSSHPTAVIVSPVSTLPARYLSTFRASCRLHDQNSDELEANKLVKYAGSGRVRVANQLKAPA